MSNQEWEDANNHDDNKEPFIANSSAKAPANRLGIIIDNAMNPVQSA